MSTSIIPQATVDIYFIATLNPEYAHTFQCKKKLDEGTVVKLNDDRLVEECTQDSDVPIWSSSRESWILYKCG